jgi:hypothetical protein
MGSSVRLPSIHTRAWSNSIAFCFWLTGAMRWRMSLGVPKVRESMSSVEMPYTCGTQRYAAPGVSTWQRERRLRRAGSQQRVRRRVSGPGCRRVSKPAPMPAQRAPWRWR